MARIMVTWGLASAALMFARGPMSFYILRALLGSAEAGLFPGVILYLTYWFPRLTLGRSSDSSTLGRRSRLFWADRSLAFFWRCGVWGFRAGSGCS